MHQLSVKVATIMRVKVDQFLSDLQSLQESTSPVAERQMPERCEGRIKLQLGQCKRCIHSNRGEAVSVSNHEFGIDFLQTQTVVLRKDECHETW